jgi:PEP-CTERM/exosortase A-associated glycosyltransferase
MSFRILHVFDHTAPLHSGYTFRSLSILREQRNRGWTTFHLSGPKQHSGQMLEEMVDDWHFFRTPPAAPSRWPGLGELALMRQLERRLQQVAEQVRPHILHAHSPVLNAWPALRVGQRLGIPVVYEVRAFWEDAAVDHGTTTEGSVRYQLSRRLETGALQRAGHVFAICDGLRRDIVGRGIGVDKVTVIRNAVDINSFKPGVPPNELLKAQLGIQGCRILGFIGSFYAYEGLDVLLDAMPAMLAQHPDLRVLLVGGGPQEAALKAQCLRLGLLDKVMFIGRVPHEQVAHFYSLIDVLVYPRHPMRLTDLVTPLKPLEAMAQGHVLVASDVGGHQELIRHGRTGLLFKAGSADALARTVLDLLAHPERWPALREAGRRYVEAERHWAGSVAGYQNVYQQLLSA